MKRRKILYLFPLAALVLSGCSFQEAVASLKSFLSNNVYHPAKDFIDGLSGKTSEEEGKEDQKPSGEEGKEDQKPSGEEGDKETPTTKHAGTLADPFDGEDAVAIANSLGAGKVSEDSYYIEGKVVSIEKEYDPQYGSYTFKIEGGFIAWQLKFGESQTKFAEGDIAVDDVVTMYAQIQLFGSENPVPETKGGYVTKVVKPTPAEELLSIEIQGNAQTSYLAGADYNHDGLSVVAHYDGAADQDVTKSVDWSISKEKAEVGDDEITITASFGGKTDSLVVHVTVNDNSGPQHAGTEADPYSGTDACIIAEGLEHNSPTADFYYISGTVQSIDEFSESYGNYTFKIEGGFLCYRLKKGSTKANFAADELKVGDAVVVYAKIMKFYEKLETNDGYVVSINGESCEQVVPPAPEEIEVGESLTLTAEGLGLSSYNDGSKDGFKWTQLMKESTTNSIQGNKSKSSELHNESPFSKNIVSVEFEIEKTAAGTARAAVSFGGETSIELGGETYALDKAGTFTVPCEIESKSFSLTFTTGASYFKSIKFNFVEEEPPVAVDSVAITEESLTLHIGGQNEKLSETLHATVLPEEATDKTVTWSIEGECATIDAASGLVTAVKSGSATVTATAGGQSDTCPVTVIKHVSGVEITESISVVAGEDSADPLQVIISPEGVTNDHFSLESNDESVATVNEQGYVHGVSAGTATITVTTEDGEFTDTCTVTVEAKVIAVESVARISEESQDLFVGDHVTLEAKVMPEDTTQSKALVWSLESGDAVTVNAESGLVEAVKEGVAVVRATSVANSGAHVDFTINVSKIAVSSVSLNETELNLVEGEDADLVATVLPNNATFNSVTWASDHSEIATVDQTGHVVAVSEGVAHITVTSDDDDTKFASCTVTVEAAPPAKGTLENPFNISEAREVAAGLTGVDGSTVYTTDSYYVRGIAKGDAEESTKTAGTYRFYVADNYEDTADLTFYWGSLDTGVEPPKAGQIVTLYGKLALYLKGSKSTYEMCADAKVISCQPREVTSVSFTSDSYDLGQGETKDMSTVVVLGPVGSEGEVVYSVSGNEKASINSSTGVLSLESDATGTVTVTATVGSISGSCTINIIEQGQEIIETKTWTAAANCFGSAISSVDGTRTGQITFNDSSKMDYTRTLEYVAGGKSDYVGMSSGYMQIGSSNALNALELSDSTNTKKITKIEIECWSKNGKGVVSVTVGGDAFGTEQSSPSSAGKLTFEPSEGLSGAIVITMSVPTKTAGCAQYIKSVTISYVK